MLRWIFLFCFLFSLTGCDTPADTNSPNAPILKPTVKSQVSATSAPSAAAPLPTTDLLNEPTPTYRFETTAEALSIWRRAAAVRPTLLLISNNPHLLPVPEELRLKAANLVSNAKLETLQQATTDRSPSPLIMPGMAVDIALRSGWFSQLVWALPLRDPAQDLDLDKFRSQLTSAGIANEEELAALTLAERNFEGSLRGTPFRAATLPLIKELSGPVIVHFDLSYFQPLYKSEIATPLLDIVLQTLSTLQKMHLETLAVTFSYGHKDTQITLGVRFLGEIIAYMLEDPARLEQDLPINWQRQRDTLYLANFFKKEEVRKLYLTQEKEDPNAAWVKYNLYRSAAEHKEGIRALTYFAEAVKLEPTYALEYMDLSNMAYDKQRPDEALRMLGLAAEVFQHDPFIKLKIVQLANELGQKEMALEMLNKIRNLEWSKTYYPNMPQYLTDLTLFVQSKEAPPQPMTEENKEIEQSPEPAVSEKDPSPKRRIPTQ